MYQKILVPIDGSPCSNQGLHEATQLAKLTGGQMRLIHLVDDQSLAMGMDTYGGGMAQEIFASLRDNGEKLLESARKQAMDQGIPVDVLLKESFGGRLADWVIEQADLWAAEVIVLGTHGRRGAQRLFLGSDAEQIVRLAKVPVLLVRYEEPGNSA